VIYLSEPVEHVQIHKWFVWYERVLRTWVIEDRYNITANISDLHLIPLAFQDS